MGFTTSGCAAATGLIVLALLAAFSFSAIVTTALANHFHTVNGIGHGFVHGGSTTDGSFFSRIDAHTPSNGFWADCTVYGNGGLTTISSESQAYDVTCNAWSGGTGLWNESQGVALVHSYDYSGQINEPVPSHYHFPH